LRLGAVIKLIYLLSKRHACTRNSNQAIALLKVCKKGHHYIIIYLSTNRSSKI